MQVAQCIKQSNIWPSFEILRLTQNMRANPGESSFAHWLLSIGDGTANDSNSMVRIPEQCIVRGNLEDLIFGTSIDNVSLQNIWKRVILCSTNEQVNFINDRIVERIAGDLFISRSVDEIVCGDGEDPTHYPTEFLNSLTPNGLPPHKLLLKIGVIVILLRNLDVKNGLCNGARLRVLQCSSTILKCEILTGSLGVVLLFQK